MDKICCLGSSRMTRPNCYHWPTAKYRPCLISFTNALIIFVKLQIFFKTAIVRADFVFTQRVGLTFKGVDETFISI